MSLAMPRMPAANTERASVVLPTVKCSTCAVAIPLNALGEHVCRGPARAAPATPVRPGISVEEASPPPQLSQLPFISSGLQRPNPPEALRRPNPNGFHIGAVVPSSRFGDYPADVPLSAVSSASMSPWPSDRDPAGHVVPSPTLPDTTSGGFAGMAGVGRRAFAAAAWSVRVGVGLANSSGGGANFVSPMEPRGPPVPMPIPTPSSNTSSPGRTVPGSSVRGSPPRDSPPGGSPPLGRNGTFNSAASRNPTPRGPVILPKAPLSGRQPTIRNASRSESRADDYRSPSRADDYRSASRADDYRSASRAEEYGTLPRLDFDTRSASAMSYREKERQRNNEPNPFFERYKQTIGSKSDQTHMTSAATPWSKEDDDDSIAGSLEDASQLPWLTSPDEPDTTHFDHQRKLTSGSIESTSSSASCGPAELRSGGGHDELVMTPNQSWEGLVERTGALNIEPLKKNNDNAGLGFNDGSLAQIGEEEEDEDEGERFVMGNPNPTPRLNIKQSGSSLPRSNSESTVTQNNSQQRILGQISLPGSSTPRNAVSANTSPTESRRPQRYCASCGDNVGGSRRFVERDGVVLCEADWKKLYLPSCRRCKQPIEKSAVSSSDGQLKGKWHRACFTCTRCDRPFDGDDFYVHDGRPWCQYHYAEENGTLCAANTCGKPIEGPCILAPGSNGSVDQRFHPGHLRCEHRGGASGAQNCRESMNEYYEIGGARFCERHANDMVRRLASGGRAEKRLTQLVDLSNPLGAPLAAGAPR